MPHKGRLYPLAQFQRLYAGVAPFPKFPAAEYALVYRFGGIFVPQLTFHALTAPVVGWTAGDLGVTWRQSCEDWAGHAMECGFIIELNADEIGWRWRPQFWQDGAELIDAFDGQFSVDADRSFFDARSTGVVHFSYMPPSEIATFTIDAVGY